MIINFEMADLSKMTMLVSHWRRPWQKVLHLVPRPGQMILRIRHTIAKVESSLITVFFAA